MHQDILEFRGKELGENSRSSTAAICLNFLIPGAGHLYLGRAARFVFAAVVLFIVLALLGLYSTMSSLQFLQTYIGLLSLLYLFGVGPYWGLRGFRFSK